MIHKSNLSDLVDWSIGNWKKEQLSSKSWVKPMLALALMQLSFQGLCAETTKDVSYAVIHQEKLTINGIVTDLNGNPLIGVSVRVKGQSLKATSTDLNGRYALEINKGESILFSMVSFKTIEVENVQSSTLNVQLEEASSEIEDVVVVAFGTQKKKEIVGSMTTINPEELKVPSSNLTTAFAGRIAGMIAYQRSGEPGADNADFFIRGVTTFGYKKDPLILIDGVEFTSTELARLQVDDIASFSIMKDAAATSLYGARGANGVILVTTKQGKEGPAKVTSV